MGVMGAPNLHERQADTTWNRSAGTAGSSGDG